MRIDLREWRRSGLVALIAFFTLTMSAVAMADNVELNSVMVQPPTKGFIVTRGTTADLPVHIKASNGDGLNGCNVDATHTATVTLTGLPAGVTVTPVVITGCDTSAYPYLLSVVIPSGTALGDTTVMTSTTGGYATTTYTEASFLFRVVDEAPPADSTPPVIVPTVTGTLGNNGWYTSDVLVSWSVTDAESVITSTTGCGATTIDFDTAGTTLTCSATSAGGTSSVSVTIMRDATAPSVSVSLDRAPAASGWFNIATGAPSALFTCADGLSGVASCPSAHLFGEGAAQSYSGTAFDNAGNSASASVTGVNVDLTAPSITWSDPSFDGSSYYFGFVPGEPTCSASDGLSGPDGCVVTGYVVTVGSHSLIATAHDVAGNEATDSQDYAVLAWTLTGFYRPVDMGGIWNSVKNGSTVPLKFEVFAGETEITDVDFLGAIFRVKGTACPAGGAVTDDVELTTTGGTTFRYDFEGGQFIQNWKTPKMKGACYEVSMTTADGSSLTARFQLK